MATYLLLRNNKNSGPYTLEALLQLGLKPYDLVWVEGKSAAWRYPSEVADLKFYAPVVEEQPYDRFYKKPSELKSDVETQSAEKKKSIVIHEEEKPAEHQKIAADVNYIQPEEVKQIPTVVETKSPVVKSPRKQVFVSLPANTGNTFIKKPEVVALSTEKKVAELYVAQTNSAVKTKQASVSYPDPLNEYKNYQPRELNQVENFEDSLQTNSTPVVETKYAQSLDDIKDIYVQTLADRKRKTAQRKMAVRMLKRGIPFAAVLLLGFVLGGFLMNHKTSGPATQAIDNTPRNSGVLKSEEAKQVPQQIVSADTTQVAGKTIQPSSSAAVNQQEEAFVKTPTGQKEFKLEKNSTAQLPLNVVKKFVARQNESGKTENAGTAIPPQSIEIDQKTGERNKVVRTSNETTTETNAVATPKSNLLKQVIVKGNNYKVGTFGGIHDLELTVTNSSNFLLDHVTVELEYLKPSDQPLKTNSVQFDNVPPNGSLTLAIPATNRGIKVKYRVVTVQSKAAGNDTAGL